MVGCSEQPEVLVGEWISTGSTGPTMTYVFGNDGQMEWILDIGAESDTFSVAYHVEYGETPIHLDVGPWSRGPLEGRTLLGIVDVLGPDRFRVDFEPALHGGDGMERPSEFTDQAVVFVRRQPSSSQGG